MTGSYRTEFQRLLVKGDGPGRRDLSGEDDREFVQGKEGTGIDRERPVKRFRRGRQVALVDRFLSLLQLRTELRLCGWRQGGSR